MEGSIAFNFITTLFSNVFSVKHLMNSELILSILHIFIPSHPENVGNFSFCCNIWEQFQLVLKLLTAYEWWLTVRGWELSPGIVQFSGEPHLKAYIELWTPDTEIRSERLLFLGTGFCYVI